jgi:hypothetical protein
LTATIATACASPPAPITISTRGSSYQRASWAPITIEIERLVEDMIADKGRRYIDDLVAMMRELEAVEASGGGARRRAETIPMPVGA